MNVFSYIDKLNNCDDGVSEEPLKTSWNTMGMWEKLNDLSFRFRAVETTLAWWILRLEIGQNMKQIASDGFGQQTLKNGHIGHTVTLILVLHISHNASKLTPSQHYAL